MMVLQPNLQTFFAIAELGNLSAAARKLKITQTAATQRLKKLESELGTALFLRSRSGMKLTREGQVLAKYCVESSRLEGQALSAFRLNGQKSKIELNVVGPVSVIAGRVLPKCQDFYTKYPQVRLNFLVHSNANRLNLLKNGMADLAFVFPHEVTSELDSRLMKPIEYVLVGSAKWKGRSLKEILAKEPLLSFHKEDATGLDYLKQYDLLKSFCNERRYANENLVLIRSIALGVGFSALPKEIAALHSSSLVILNQGKTLELPIALAWYPRQEMPKYFKDVIETLA